MLTRGSRKVKLSLVPVFFFFLVLVFVGFQFYFNPLTNKSVTINVEKGMTVRELAQELKKEKIVSHPFFFILLARIRRVDRHLQAGQYHLAAGITTSKLLSQLVEGKVILHSVTFIEGWTFADALHTLENNPYLQHTLLHKTPKQVMAAIGYPKQHPEGQIYPDTYLFGKGISDKTILEEATKKMHTILSSSWQQRAKNLPYKNAYQALIMASLIEKETSIEKEKPEVAGVLVRRLKQNMLLQVDPTVIYALGAHFDGDITREDLRVKSPYNTYLYKGLPPTPIALPDKSSILAALHPKSGKALYYVARGDGSHVFSDTLAEHNKAVVMYILEQEKKKLKYRLMLDKVIEMFSGKNNVCYY